MIDKNIWKRERQKAGHFFEIAGLLAVAGVLWCFYQQWSPLPELLGAEAAGLERGALISLAIAAVAVPAAVGACICIKKGAAHLEYSRILPAVADRLTGRRQEVAEIAGELALSEEETVERLRLMIRCGYLEDAYLNTAQTVLSYPADDRERMNSIAGISRAGWENGSIHGMNSAGQADSKVGANGGALPEAVLEMESRESVAVRCPHCGATNYLVPGTEDVCNFCDSPLAADE